jgi:hypothetical protein
MVLVYYSRADAYEEELFGANIQYPQKSVLLQLPNLAGRT